MRRLEGMFEIRPATPEDYPHLCDLYNEIEPEHFETPKEILEEDRGREAHLLHAIFVALEDNRIVGSAKYSQFAGMYHPRHFGVYIQTPHRFWESGVQDELYTRLRHELEPHDPIRLLSTTRENRPRENRPHEIAWLERHGFTVKQRTWEMRLELNAFLPETWINTLERVRSASYALKPLSAFEDTPEFRRALYQCWLECRRDVPRPGTTTEPSFEQFSHREFGSAYLARDGYWVAVAPDGELVALSALWKTEETGVLYTGLTGTARSHRQTGLGLALKVASLEWAKRAGYTRIVTWNEQGNETILAINVRLGFAQRPAWIDYTLTLREE